VFALVGKSMGERRIAPDVLSAIPDACGSVVAGHRVNVTYVSGKRAGPRTGHYVVTIAGNRINARWRFRSSELEKLSRSVAKAVGHGRGAGDVRDGLGVEVW
jgi:hypothetical protein